MNKILCFIKNTGIVSWDFSATLYGAKPSTGMGAEIREPSRRNKAAILELEAMPAAMTVQTLSLPNRMPKQMTAELENGFFELMLIQIN